jgi:hypothetical protein
LYIFFARAPVKLAVAVVIILHAITPLHGT